MILSWYICCLPSYKLFSDDQVLLKDLFRVLHSKTFWDEPVHHFILEIDFISWHFSHILGLRHLNFYTFYRLWRCLRFSWFPFDMRRERWMWKLVIYRERAFWLVHSFMSDSWNVKLLIKPNLIKPSMIVFSLSD